MGSTTIINNSNDIDVFRRTVSSNCSLTEFSVDLEGDNLCRNGKINYIQLYVIQTDQVFIFNCSCLEKSDVKSALGPLFEQKSISKYMFDCRSDVDALYHQYDIKLNGVVDVQLYEIGFRKCNGQQRTRFYHGLYKTLSEYGHQLSITRNQLAIKDRYSMQFKQKNFLLNVNDPDVLEYLRIDIIYLKKLYQIFNSKVGHGNIRMKIERETESRQNTWMKPHYVNDRTFAISAI